MTLRQWSSYMADLHARNVKDGQTGYDTGDAGLWYGTDTDGVFKLSLGNPLGNKVTWNGTTLAVTGNITLQAGAVDTTNLVDGAVTGGKLAADSVTADKIDAGAVTADAIAADSVTATKIDVDDLSAISADLGDITAGTLTLNDTGAFIKLGTATYGSGVGFIVEYNAGTPRLMLGDASGDNLDWSGSGLAISGSVNLSNTVQTFTPIWTGFSSAPSGDISYIDIGKLVILFSASSLTGTSNGAAMAITNLPAAIKPASGTRKIPCIVVDDGLSRSGMAEPDASGDFDFYLETPNTADARVDLAANSFKTSGTKGLAAGWSIMYPK
jgi:hypothetical protein